MMGVRLWGAVVAWVLLAYPVGFISADLAAGWLGLGLALLFASGIWNVYMLGKLKRTGAGYE